MVNKKCIKCGKTLATIGLERKNGKAFYSGANNNKDWIERGLHKKCWKEQEQEQEFMQRCKEAAKKWKAQEEAKMWLDMFKEELNENIHKIT